VGSLKSVPSTESLASAPLDIVRRYRGVEYHLHELNILEYDKIEKEATSEGPDGIEKIDAVHRSRRLLQDTCVSPRLSLDQIVHMPFRLGNTLMRDVNDMYYTFDAVDKEPDAEEADDDKKGED
jgi:hypothetical protein